MNRLIGCFCIVIFGALTSAAQVAQSRQPAAQPATPAATVTPGVSASGAGAVNWLNLRTGEVVGAESNVVAAPGIAARQPRAPSLVGSSITPVQFQNINR